MPDSPFPNHTEAMRHIADADRNDAEFADIFGEMPEAELLAFCAYLQRMAQCAGESDCRHFTLFAGCALAGFDLMMTTIHNRSQA